MYLKITSKQSKNRNRAWPRIADLGFLGMGSRGGMRILGVWEMKNFIPVVDKQWDPTVEYREISVIGSLS